MEMLQGVSKQHPRPRAVVGYGVKIFLPGLPITSPHHLVIYSRSLNAFSFLLFLKRCNRRLSTSNGGQLRLRGRNGYSVSTELFFIS